MLKFIVFLVVFVFLFFVMMRYAERKSLYVPFKEIDGTPQNINLEYQEIALKTPDHETIQAWFIPKLGSPWTVYFLHGNGGNLSHRLTKISMLHDLGLNVFIIDYRGYGQSTGAPSERGFYVDSRTGYEYLTKALKVRPDRIILFGESLGSAVAIDLATKEKVAALIVEGMLTSASEIARVYFPFAPGFFLEAKFDSLSKIRDLGVPKLFIHSRNDEVVPFWLGKKLFDASAPPKEFLEIIGGHNDSFSLSRKEVEDKMSEFVKGLKMGGA